MHKDIIISVIMPTLNSQDTIAIALESIKKQDFDAGKMEILVIDGGSTDKTREIALSYGAQIIKNPQKLPEIAKHIGVQTAVGKYAMFLDSDEELMSSSCVSQRIKLFQDESSIHAIGPTGIKNPPGYPKLSEYINIAGDPFSYFVYGMEGDIYLDSCKRIYRYKSFSSYTKIIFSETDILPIGDGGSFTFDLSYLREKFKNEIQHVRFISNLFERAVSEKKELGIVNNDFITHYSSTKLSRYFSKIQWRIINNIFYPSVSGAGFINREIPKNIKIKKYLFIPYGISIIFPFITSCLLVIRKKNVFYFMHAVFSFYTAIMIIWYMSYNVLGLKKPKLTTYGK